MDHGSTQDPARLYPHPICNPEIVTDSLRRGRKQEKKIKNLQKYRQKSRIRIHIALEW